ncbi:MAG: MaoC family dehydratase [Acidimicrobiia bacterium]|nr:MaoC family dehydratase [Acidimicrobiia bacterium]
MPRGVCDVSVMDMAGADLGHSEWFVVDQQRVNDFADVTLDHQFIHVDPEAAGRTPFGGTIVHGFLTTSLLVHLAGSLTIAPDNTVMGLNYGFNKLRYLSPVPVGSAIRAHVKVADISERSPGQYLLTYDVSVEIKGEEKPALVAEWLNLLITS